MVMKAIKKGMATHSEPSSARDDSSVNVDNEVVMVLFPGETWANVRRIGKECELEPQEVISAALALLDEKLSNRDGA